MSRDGLAEGACAALRRWTTMEAIRSRSSEETWIFLLRWLLTRHLVPSREMPVLSRDRGEAVVGRSRQTNASLPPHPVPSTFQPCSRALQKEDDKLSTYVVDE